MEEGHHLQISLIADTFLTTILANFVPYFLSYPMCCPNILKTLPVTPAGTNYVGWQQAEWNRSILGGISCPFFAIFLITDWFPPKELLTNARELTRDRKRPFREPSDAGSDDFNEMKKIHSDTGELKEERDKSPYFEIARKWHNGHRLDHEYTYTHSWRFYHCLPSSKYGELPIPY